MHLLLLTAPIKSLRWALYSHEYSSIVEAAAFLVPPRFAHLPSLMNLPSAAVPEAGELYKEHRISQQAGGSKKLDCNCGKVKSWASDTAAFQRLPYGVGLVSNGLQLKRRII